jgi:hypothetical protein
MGAPAAGLGGGFGGVAFQGGLLVALQNKKKINGFSSSASKVKNAKRSTQMHPIPYCL